MGRRPCCAKEGVNRGIWSAGEDKILINYIKLHGEGKWRDLPQRAGLKRCGKSCRLRWLNYLRPGIKRGNICADEEELIIRLHNLLGNRWSLIAGRLPGRTDNEIKNYWNTNLSKRVEEEKNKDLGKQFDKSVPQNKALMEASQPSAKAPQVIRTKATRCTRLFFPHGLENDATNKPNSFHSMTNEASPSFSSTRETDVSSDFLADFNLDDLLPSDAHPNPDLCCRLQANESDFHSHDLTISMHDGPINFHSKGHENSRENELLHLNGSIDFNALASFLNSDDDCEFKPVD